LIFFSLGLPGRLAEWCDAVLVRLASRLPGGASLTTWPPITKMLGYDGIAPVLDQVAISLIETGAAHLVMGARQPDERLRASLTATNSRFVVALDDPRCAVAEILGDSNADLKAVTRAIANSCPLVMQCANSPGAITIRGHQAEFDAVGAVSAIAQHFELSLDDGEAERIVEELAVHDLCYIAKQTTNWWKARCHLMPSASPATIWPRSSGRASCSSSTAILAKGSPTPSMWRAACEF